MAQLTTYPRGLLTLTGSLLTQVEASEAASLATVTGQAGGLVVSGRDALQVAEHLTWRGYPAPLLADRQRYKGNRRKLAPEPLTRLDQPPAPPGLPAIIPDAGYVPQADLVGLRSCCSGPRRFRGRASLLALANWWMYDEGLALLLAELRAADLPVALVLEHRDDPLSVSRIAARNRSCSAGRGHDADAAL